MLNLDTTVVFKYGHFQTVGNNLPPQKSSVQMDNCTRISNSSSENIDIRFWDTVL